MYQYRRTCSREQLKNSIFIHQVLGSRMNSCNPTLSMNNFKPCIGKLLIGSITPHRQLFLTELTGRIHGMTSESESALADGTGRAAAAPCSRFTHARARARPGGHGWCTHWQPAGHRHSMSGAPKKMAKPGGTKRRIRRGSVNDNDRGVHWTARRSFARLLLQRQHRRHRPHHQCSHRCSHRHRRCCEG